MKPLLHIYGASGSGTSTLGRYLAEQFQYAFLDSDDYFWLPTDPKFTTKRPIEQRVPLIRQDIAAAKNGAVLSGSLVGWGDALIPDFTLAVRVVTDTSTRLARKNNVSTRGLARAFCRTAICTTIIRHFCSGPPVMMTAGLTRAALCCIMNGRSSLPARS